ncbi:Axin-1 [Bagarius yarrelli]|uniref:Axin-1 n=1 Tax=Bagarius yarrelli TaxID=175774 RepID=A0A556VAG3_BAGYA|nr:Axin-1 [Bagarius yarrelli]
MMTTRVAHCHGDTSGYFGQGVLRPPVPGEENTNSDTVRPESYEPEGRDSSDYAHPSWAESLQSLLDDQDGISLFRDFLAQEGLTDLIDFWLACRGFQLAFLAPVSCLSTSLDVINKRRLKLAKAIYRKYIISNGVVTKRIRAMTKNSLCERICHLELDSALFLQAKQEVQDGMEAEVYPLFLKSYLFLTNAQETCIEQKVQTWELNTHKQETGNDQQEMNSSMQEPESGKKELKQKTENKQREVLQFFPEQVETNHKRPEHWEAGSRGKCVCEIVKVAYYFCGEPIPYRSTFRGQAITLAQFKQLLTKKGEYRFFFKKASDEFDCGVVYEEVCEDDAVLPVFQGKIIGKVEKTY